MPDRGILSSAAVAEEFARRAVHRVAEELGPADLRANRTRVTHWSADHLATQYGQWARRLYETPREKVRASHLGGVRQQRETGLGHRGLKHLLPTAAALVLAEPEVREAIGSVAFTLVKVFESQFENEAFQKPHQYATMSPLDSERRARGTKSGRYAHVLLVAVTETDVCLPIAVAPLVKDAYQPVLFESAARRDGIALDLAAEELERHVREDIETRTRRSIGFAGRDDLPFTEDDILAELFASASFGETLAGAGPIFTGVPALGGWLVGAGTLPSAVRAPLVGHSLEAMLAHTERGYSCLFDLIAPSQLETLTLRDLPWRVDVASPSTLPRSLSGIDLAAALDAQDATVWTAVNPALTPDEQGDDYWFVARGSVTIGDGRHPVSLVAHVNVEDGLVVDQVRACLQDLSGEDDLRTTTLLSLAEARVHLDAGVDKLREALFVQGALDVRPGKVIGENLTAIALWTACVKVLSDPLGWPSGS